MNATTRRIVFKTFDNSRVVGDQDGLLAIIFAKCAVRNAYDSRIKTTVCNRCTHATHNRMVDEVAKRVLKAKITNVQLSTYHFMKH